MTERYSVFSQYAPDPGRHPYYSGHARGGPDVGQGCDIPPGWDPYTVLRRYSQTANDAEEATA